MKERLSVSKGAKDFLKEEKVKAKEMESQKFAIELYADEIVTLLSSDDFDELPKEAFREFRYGMWGVSKDGKIHFEHEMKKGDKMIAGNDPLFDIIYAVKLNKLNKNEVLKHARENLNKFKRTTKIL